VIFDLLIIGEVETDVSIHVLNIFIGKEGVDILGKARGVHVCLQKRVKVKRWALLHGTSDALRMGWLGMPEPPRYLPDEPLPPYAFVPQLFPHPTRDPGGHSFGVRRDQPTAPDPNRWRACRPYLYGIDLFNHGYYWEAHESWESLWHACGRTGLTGDFLRALIRLAAAGVKAREGRSGGVRRHALAAQELFQRIALELGANPYMGLHLDDLCRFAADAATTCNLRPVEGGAKVGVVFPWRLLLS
jgi:uncharacterized protein